MKLPKYPIVKVYWDDSHTTAGWTPVEQLIEDRQLDCVSVGFLLHESKQSIVVASHITVAGKVTQVDADGAMTIPRKSIKRIVRV